MFDTLKEAKAWVREHSVVVKARQRKPYTYIEVHAYEIDLRVERDAWAVAKCNPRDEWSDKIGIDKARGEAEAIIARRLVRGCCGRASDEWMDMLKQLGTGWACQIDAAFMGGADANAAEAAVQAAMQGDA